MARARRTTTPTADDMPASLREYHPGDWPPPLERVEPMAATWGRARMAAIVSRSLWSAARRAWLHSRGLRTVRDLEGGA
ncbi:hypothetical protein Lsed01_00177 [Demequina sediminis]|uniref:Uncharacterized protein n=2 Tax=Demequina sediminis TaxID=1930058 RepID=A0ABP9WD59_9MICO|nr:hypothetical protein GCM10025873_06500 [Demequina sediminis]